MASWAVRGRWTLPLPVVGRTDPEGQGGRQDRQRSVVVPTAVNGEGKREIIGMDVGTSEDGASENRQWWSEGAIRQPATLTSGMATMVRSRRPMRYTPNSTGDLAPRPSGTRRQAFSMRPLEEALQPTERLNKEIPRRTSSLTGRPCAIRRMGRRTSIPHTRHSDLQRSSSGYLAEATGLNNSNTMTHSYTT